MTNRRESQLRNPRPVSPASLDLSFDGVQELFADRRHALDRAKQVRSSPALELLLDDVGERFPGSLASRQGLVGLHVDGDGLDGHALIMHLQAGTVKPDPDPSWG